MNFKRILVAINHSPLTSIVFDRALNLAQQEQANLMILHCLVDFTAIDQGSSQVGPLDSIRSTLGFLHQSARKHFS
ncbi:hypothetical protein CK516_32235 [Nostoc sp. 'Peltigera malacea cyanobiont' DB3992]|nr:hypothetical protein CK516_32235 [Nostoc sp. 'Peltigera malacea cyanobiont' DB3992]